MDNAALLLGLVEQGIGKGRRTSGNNFAFYCPICNHRKPKLELDFDSEYYHCWTCQPITKGRGVVSLLKKLRVSSDIIKEVQRYSKYKTKQETQSNTEIPLDLKLPPEYIPLTNTGHSVHAKHAIAYLESRGLTKEDILKYSIGYCESGRYYNSVIIPSYDANGRLNYFISRTLDKESQRKYNAPKVNKREIVGFENYINWGIPVILCEGSFDAIAIKRNAVPLFGKSITEALMLRLVQPEVKTVYVCLDEDALKDAFQHCQKLLDLGKEVYLVELEGKDPSELGFEKMLNLLHAAKPLSPADLLRKRLSKI